MIVTTTATRAGLLKRATSARRGLDVIPPYRLPMNRPFSRLLAVNHLCGMKEDFPRAEPRGQASGPPYKRSCAVFNVSPTRSPEGTIREK